MRGVSGKKWVLLSELITPDELLSNKLGYIKAQLLANRRVDESILESKLKNLLPPFHIPNILEAVNLISDFVRAGKRIVIFGDYDVDGVTGTAILYDLLKRAGARVLPMLPSRKKGYGLTKDLVRKLNAYADLLLTVDNGTTAQEELSLCNIPTIILDHHNPGDSLPKALIVNPKLGNGEFEEFKEISSSGLAFYLAILLRKELGIDADVREYLHLACLGTVSDVMPMNLLNRIIVFNGLKLLNHTLRGSFNAPGIRLLMERSGIKQDVSSRDIAFSIAPRLNAPGRVARPYIAFRLLLEKDEKRAKALVEKIDRLNQYRRRLSQLAFEEALKQATQQKGSVIVVKLEDWAGGVAGIVAGRLSSLFSKPVVVLSLGKEYSSASVRGPEGMDVYLPLKMLSHLFVKWGGHKSAAGFTIRTEDIKVFENLAEEVFSKVPVLENNLYIDMPMPTHQVREDLYNLLRDLEPYGEGFPEPTFLSEPVEMKLIKKEGDRILLRAGNFYLYCWDARMLRRLNFPVRKRVAYQIDRRRSNTLLLVDVEA